MFYTERLCLRGLQPGDTENIIAMETDPRITPNIFLRYWRPAKPDFGDEIKKRWDNSIWSAVVVTRETNEFVGVLGLGLPPDTPNRNGALAICVAPQHWSKGYGAEMLRFLLKHAFLELGLHKVWLQVHAENASAIALYKKW